MTSANYFPSQRHLAPLAQLQRERLLPPGVNAQVEVQRGARVGLRDVIAGGEMPAPFVQVDAADFLRLRNPLALPEYMTVEVGDEVDAGTVIAERRRRRLTSPIDGRVAFIGQGKVVLQYLPDPVTLEAGMNGVVVAVRPGRGVVIETYSAVVQGVWGNNRLAIGTLRTEPDDGLESIYADAIEIQYRGAIMVTRRNLTAVTLQVIQDQQFSGVIAPGMPTDLIDAARESSCAILLTEGFGVERMSAEWFNFLDELDGRQALLEAQMPQPLEARRPEVLITVPLTQGQRPRAMRLEAVLEVGMRVGIVRENKSRVTGEILDLPKTPVLLDNGLRVAGAVVQLLGGERLTVPLANIEILTA